MQLKIVVVLGILAFVFLCTLLQIYFIQNKNQQPTLVDCTKATQPRNQDEELRKIILNMQDEKNRYKHSTNETISRYHADLFKANETLANMKAKLHTLLTVTSTILDNGDSNLLSNLRSKESRERSKQIDGKYHAVTKLSSIIASRTVKHDTGSLPRTGVVILAALNPTHDETASLHAWQCYCLQHGYQCFMEFNGHFQYTENRNSDGHIRRIAAVQKYLPRFQWLLLVEPSTWLVNRDIKLEAFIDGKYDVQLNLKEDGDISTKAILIKNSQYSWQFLRNWLEWSNRPNGHVRRAQDNEAFDLFWTVSRTALQEKQSEQCIKLYHDKKHQWPITSAAFRKCVVDTLKPDDNIYIAPVLSPKNMIRTVEMYLYQSGPQKTVEKNGWSIYYSTLFPGDFMIHSHHLDKIIPDEDVLCEKPLPKSMVSVEVAKKVATELGYGAAYSERLAQLEIMV